MMTDAPDPGLTDLIAAHLTELIADAPEEDNYDAGYVAALADLRDSAAFKLVVEQHTNGRIAELEAAVAEAERRGDEQFNLLDETLTADRNRIAKRCNIAEATIARVRAVEAEYLDPEDADIECREDVWRFIRDLRAAVRGES